LSMGAANLYRAGRKVWRFSFVSSFYVLPLVLVFTTTSELVLVTPPYWVLG